jgi:hypothetical protein
MKTVLTLRYSQMYLLAMIYKGHASTNVARHLGAWDAWSTTNILTIEKTLPFPVFDRTSHQKRLTPEGLEYAKKCLQCLEILVPNYTEPKGRSKKSSPLF